MIHSPYPPPPASISSRRGSTWYRRCWLVPHVLSAWFARVVRGWIYYIHFFFVIKFGEVSMSIILFVYQVFPFFFLLFIEYVWGSGRIGSSLPSFTEFQLSFQLWSHLHTTKSFLKWYSLFLQTQPSNRWNSQLRKSSSITTSLTSFSKKQRYDYCENTVQRFFLHSHRWFTRSNRIPANYCGFASVGTRFFFFTEFYRVSPTTAGEGVEKKQTADGNVLMRIHPFLCLSLSLSLSLATYLSREEERKEARKGNKKEDLHDIDDARWLARPRHLPVRFCRRYSMPPRGSQKRGLIVDESVERGLAHRRRGLPLAGGCDGGQWRPPDRVVPTGRQTKCETKKTPCCGLFCRQTHTHKRASIIGRGWPPRDRQCEFHGWPRFFFVTQGSDGFRVWLARNNGPAGGRWWPRSAVDERPQAEAEHINQLQQS